MSPRSAAVAAVALLACCSGEPPLPRFAHPLPGVSRRELLALLRQGDWGALETRFDALEAAARADIAREVDLPIAYDALSVDAPGVREGIGAWLVARPRSLNALLVRGLFLHAEGWRRRGADFSRETSAVQFAGMSASFEAAASDLRRVLDLDAERVEAWAALMTIASAQGDVGGCRRLAEEALRHRPASFRIRQVLQHCLQPRWGGSSFSMRVAARSAREHFAANPRLASLYGFADADRSDWESEEKRFEKALELANRALATGEAWQFYAARARALAGLGRHDEALHALGLALDLDPEAPQLLVDHAEQALATGDVRRAQGDFVLLRQVEPGHPDFRWLQGRLREAGALASEEGAAGEAPADVADWLAAARDACSLADADPAPCLALQNLLARAGRWDEVVEAWSGYLERTPDDTLALKARAAAAYRLGRAEEALADLGRGCSLGDADACRVQASVRAASRIPR